MLIRQLNVAGGNMSGVILGCLLLIASIVVKTASGAEEPTSMSIKGRDILQCPMMIIANTSDEEFIRHDYLMFKSAQLGCIRKYPKSPCLKKFTKVRKQGYTVLCTQKDRSNNDRDSFTFQQGDDASASAGGNAP